MNETTAEKDAPSPLERWIQATHAPSESASAELSYERMESQSGEILPVIYQPLDATNRSHWHDIALTSAFAESMKGAWLVLDVGPGDGWPCLRIADRFPKIVGIDPSPRRVRVQRENAARLGIGNVEFREMDVLSMSFGNATFDAVAAASSVEQSLDPPRALTEINRVLEPGGCLALIFEDYDRYFSDCIGDERLWTEIDGAETVLFYRCRRKTPPREATYGMFLDTARLKSESSMDEAISDLSRNPITIENLDEGREDVSRHELLELSFFQQIAPFVSDARYFELQHLTSRAIDDLLTRTGFVDIRHLDARIPDCLALFDSARESGRLEILTQQMVPIGELFGEMAVRRAAAGPGNFVIARKPV